MTRHLDAAPPPGPARNPLQAVLDRAAQENFPVIPRFLPRRYRHHLGAVYGFARLVDDIADQQPAADRMRRLDMVEADLDRMLAGTPRLAVTQALAPTVAACQISADPFRRLIQAGRQDQTVTRYATYDDLLGYCALAADPIGHIVLHVFRAATPQRIQLAAHLSRALQLIDIIQDIQQDLRNDRIYLPAEDLNRFGCGEQHLAAATPDPCVRHLVAFETARAERLLDDGARILRTLDGFALLATAGYVGGGRAQINAIRAARYDVLTHRPTARPARRISAWLYALARR